MARSLLEGTLEFSMYLTRPDGRIPIVGDIDNARSICFYQPDDMWNLRAFLAIGAVLFNRGDMKYVAGEPCEDILWLMGTEDMEKFKQIQSQKPAQISRAFVDSGYFIMRDGWGKDSNYCSFDCGEIADGVYSDNSYSAAHGHCDLLSIELAVNGKAILIDPGFHNYFSSEEWHRYFRSTAGHDTIEIEGNGHAKYVRRLTWSNAVKPELIHWLSTAELNLAGGRVPNFANLTKSISHERYILFSMNRYFLIIDVLYSDYIENKKYQITSSFHFSPGNLSIRANQILRNNDVIALMAIPPQTNISFKKGGNSPEEGWIAPGFGSKSPHRLCNYRSKINCQYKRLWYSLCK